MLHDWRNLVPVNGLVLTTLVIGLANNVLIAAAFGLTRNVDAFYAAMMLPSLFMFLCVDYLGKNFLPMLTLAKKESEASAASLISTIVTVVLLLSGVVAAILSLVSVPVFGLLLPGFDPAETALVSRYFWIMAPAIALMAVSSIHEYVCHYDEKFVSVMAIRMALPVANLIAIVLVGPFAGEYCLPIGYLAGHVTVFALMARLARYRYSPRISVRAHLEKRIFTNSAVMMSTGLVARTRSIVMNVLASALGGGAITALAFAAKLTEPLERSAFAGAKMVMFSRSARLFADGNEREVAHLYGIGLRVSFLLLAPMIGWIGLNSEALVALLFARGEFTPEMTTFVAAALLALVPSVLFIGVNQLLANVFYAMNRIKVPTLVAFLAMLLYVSVAVPLSNWLGVQGIALATTLTSVVAFSAQLVALSRTLPGLQLGPLSLNLMGYAALGGIIMIPIVTVLRQVDWAPLLVTGASLLAGTLTYVAALALVRDRTFDRLVRFVRVWIETTRRNHRVAAP